MWFVFELPAKIASIGRSWTEGSPFMGQHTYVYCISERVYISEVGVNNRVVVDLWVRINFRTCKTSV